MNLSQQDWKKQLATDENAIVLDVRTAEECLDGIIFNALNIDIYEGQEFIHKIDELDKSKNYYVYCKAGSRSDQACKIMNEMGFVNTYNLLGGFMNWDDDVYK